jgi:hypothetical protein
MKLDDNPLHLGSAFDVEAAFLICLLLYVTPRFSRMVKIYYPTYLERKWL